jgi:2-methylisocitrate lyase-like PEP mutase family enzyme
MGTGSKLRALLEQQGILVVPGVYDSLSARIASVQGFNVLSISGYGVEASALGKPDLGLATMDTVVRQAKYIVESTDAAIICDIDTGFGGVLNVWQTVKEMQWIGVAAVHIEDQTTPKKCGGMPGRSVVSIDHMVGKIGAALDGRGNGDMVIIARTDAREKYGIDESIDRLNAYLDAGADMGLIAEHCGPQELERAAYKVKGPLCILGGIPGWPESLLPLETYKDWGIKVVVYPLLALYAAAKAIREVNELLKSPELVSQEAVESKVMGFDEFNEIMGLSFWSSLAERYERE